MCCHLVPLHVQEDAGKKKASRARPKAAQRVPLIDSDWIVPVTLLEQCSDGQACVLTIDPQRANRRPKLPDLIVLGLCLVLQDTHRRPVN